MKEQLEQLIQKETHFKSAKEQLLDLENRIAGLSNEAATRRPALPAKRRSEGDGPSDDACDRPRKRSRGDGGCG